MSLYNPYRIPSAYSIAYDHQMARKPGSQISHEFVCPCCLLPIKDTLLPINFEIDKIKTFGYEYSYYFQICKIVLIALLILAIDSGIPALQDSFMIAGVVLPIGNNEIRLSPLQPGFPASKFMALSFLSFITLFLVLLVIRSFISLKMKGKQVGEQKWSVLLKNIPRTASTQQKITDLFQTNFDGVSIKQILLIPKSEELQQIEDEIESKISEWKKVLGTKQRSKEDVLICLKNIEKSVNKLDEWKQKCSNGSNEELFSGNALVIFQNSEHVEEVLRTPFLTKNKIEASFGQAIFGDKQTMEISRCPSPQEVIWKNIAFSTVEKKGKEKLAYIYFVLVCGIFMLVYFLTQLTFGRQVGREDQIDINRPASILGLSLLSLLHYLLLPLLISRIQKEQRYISETEKQVGLMVKYSCFTIFFRVLILLSVESIFYSGTNIVLATVNKITVMFFIDLILGSLVWMIHPAYIFKKIRHKFFADRNKQTQKEANQLFQNPSFNVGLKYALALNMFWLSAVLGNIVPIGTLVLLMTMLSLYWISKLNFAKRESLDRCRINSQALLKKFIECMEWSLILKPSINLLFWGLAQEEVPYQQIFMLICGVAYNFVDKQFLLAKLFHILRIKQSTKSVNTPTDGQNIEEKKQQNDKLHNPENMSSLYCHEIPTLTSFEKKRSYLEKKYGKVLQFRLQKFDENEAQVDLNNENFPHDNQLQMGIESDRKMSEKGSSSG